MIEATRLEGCSRRGAAKDRGRGKLAAGNSRLDSTQLRSSSSRSFSLCFSLAPFLRLSQTYDVYWCIGTRFKPLCAAPRVDTDACIRGGVF